MCDLIIHFSFFNLRATQVRFYELLKDHQLKRT